MSDRAVRPPSSSLPAARLLAAVPLRNRTMAVERRSDGTALAAVPLRRPRWMIPPLSWFLPYSTHRRVQLDRPGTEVLDLCDGRRTVEQIVEKFAADHKLTFREAQLAIGQFLQSLTQRGLIAVACPVEDRKGK